MKTNKTIALTAVMVPTMLVTLSGCGKEDPKDAFAKAYDRQSALTQQSATIRMEMDGETILKHLLSSDGLDSRTAEEKVKQKKQAQALLMSSYTIEMKTKDGTPISQNADKNNMDIGLMVDHSNSRLASLIAVGNNIYAQVDTKKINEVYDLVPLEQYEQMVKSTESIAWTKYLFANKWVGLDEELTKKAAEQVDQKAKEAAGEDTAAVKKISDSVKNNLHANAQFEWKGDDVVQMTVPMKKVTSQFVTDMKTINPKMTSDELKSLEELPTHFKEDGTMIVDMKIKNGVNQQVRFDVGNIISTLDPSKFDSAEDKQRIDELAKQKTSIVVDLKEAADNLKAPGDYAKIDQESISSLLFSGMMAGAGETTYEGVPSETTE